MLQKRQYTANCREKHPSSINCRCMRQQEPPPAPGQLGQIFSVAWVKTRAALVCMCAGSATTAVTMDFLYIFMNHICPAMGAVIALLMFASPMKAVRQANRDKDLGVSAVGGLSAAPHTAYSRLNPQQDSNAVLGTAAGLELQEPQAAAQTAVGPCSSPAYTHTHSYPGMPSSTLRSPMPAAFIALRCLSTYTPSHTCQHLPVLTLSYRPADTVAAALPTGPEPSSFPGYCCQLYRLAAVRHPHKRPLRVLQ